MNMEKVARDPSGKIISYIPSYFNKATIPLKRTSRIIPVTGFNKEAQALLIKPEASLYIQTNVQCNAKCPNCLLGYKGMSVFGGCLPFSNKFFTALRFVSEHLGIHNCSITGGEPTLFPERLKKLFEMLPKGLRNITLFTNGTNLLKKIENKTLLEHLVSNRLTELVINCIHPEEKIRAKLINPLVTNKEYYEIVEICKNHLIDIRLSWVLDTKRVNQLSLNKKIDSLLTLGSYLNVPEIILRIPTRVIGVNDSEKKKSEKLWEKGVKYLERLTTQTPKIVKRSVKTRAYYKFNSQIIILEVYHEEKQMKTDIGTLMLSSGKNPQDVNMTYRWLNGVKKHSINYQAKPWASKDFFRKPERREDPYRNAIRELL